MEPEVAPNRGRVVDLVVESDVLRGNPLGDPWRRRVPVYLPPSYEAEGSRRYPVIFVLAGFTGRGAMLLNDALFSEPLNLRMDRLIAAGCPEGILAMPDCSTRWGGSQYVDSAATGRYEEHVVAELVPWIDKSCRTAPGARAVMGKSSGGFGALSLLLRRPGVFQAGACHSGDMYFEHCYLRDFADAADILHAHGGLAAFLDAIPGLTGGRLKSAFKALNIVAMASCYSPSVDGPRGIGLPFRERTGEILRETWERWLAFDPVRMVEQRAAALKGLKLLFLDCGTKDEFGLHLGARILAERLEAHGVEFEHEEFQDGHFDIGYRQDVSIPKLLRAIG